MAALAQQWLQLALAAARGDAADAKELKAMRWMAFEVSRAAFMKEMVGRASGPQLLELYDDAMSAVGRHMQLGRKARPAECRRALKDRGCGELANLLGDLGKGRRFPAHPSTDVLAQIDRAFAIDGKSVQDELVSTDDDGAITSQMAIDYNKLSKCHDGREEEASKFAADDVDEVPPGSAINKGGQVDNMVEDGAITTQIAIHDDKALAVPKPDVFDSSALDLTSVYDLPNVDTAKKGGQDGAITTQTAIDYEDKTLPHLRTTRRGLLLESSRPGASVSPREIMGWERLASDLPSMGRGKGQCCRDDLGSGVSSVLDEFHHFLEKHGQLDVFQRMAKLGES